MEAIKDKIKSELDALYNQGLGVLMTIADQEDDKTMKKEAPPIQMLYQTWYSKALPVVRQLLPERYAEFQQQYLPEKRKDGAITVTSYTISDFLNGITVTKTDWQGQTEQVFSAFSVFLSRFRNQLFILNSAQERIGSLLANIESALQSGLFDSELHAAEDLRKKGHLRAAGALAGVTLEAHLGNVAANHQVAMRKSISCISDFNEELHKKGVFDIPTWRLIQRLGDIRNLCVHAKEREPTTDEVDDLVEGTKKIVATVF